MLQILSNINENSFVNGERFLVHPAAEFLPGNLAQEEIINNVKYVSKSDGQNVIGVIDDIRSRKYNEDTTFRSGMIYVWPLSPILKFRTDQCNINFDILIKFISPLIDNKTELIIKHSDYTFEFINNFSLPLYSDSEGCFAINKFFETQKSIAKLIGFDSFCKTILAQGR